MLPIHYRILVPVVGHFAVLVADRSSQFRFVSLAYQVPRNQISCSYPILSRGSSYLQILYCKKGLVAEYDDDNAHFDYGFGDSDT